MKGITMFLFAFLLVFATMASAEVTNHWPTVDQCLSAKNSPFYYPSILSQQKLAKDEVVLGHPTGGCADMDLPDRFGKRGWVRIELGRKLVYGPDGTIRRLEECNNHIHGFVAFPLVAALRGEVGPRGPQGPEGPRGFTGKSGKDFTPTKRPLCGESWRTGRRWGCAAVVAIIGGFAASQMGGDGDKEQVTTLPPCTSLPCN